MASGLYTRRIFAHAVLRHDAKRQRVSLWAAARTSYAIGPKSNSHYSIISAITANSSVHDSRGPRSRRDYSRLTTSGSMSWVTQFGSQFLDVFAIAEHAATPPVRDFAHDADALQMRQRLVHRGWREPRGLGQRGRGSDRLALQRLMHI
jgi:hypothetical protein